MLFCIFGQFYACKFIFFQLAFTVLSLVLSFRLEYHCGYEFLFSFALSEKICICQPGALIIGCTAWLPLCLPCASCTCFFKWYVHILRSTQEASGKEMRGSFVLQRNLKKKQGLKVSQCAFPFMLNCIMFKTCLDSKNFVYLLV